MIITIDIGNTNITFGVFNKDSDRPVHSANIQSDKSVTTDELAIKYLNLRQLWNLKSDNPHEDVMICSVVPQIDYEFTHMFYKYFNTTPYFVKNEDVPLALHYDNPVEIGADRVVNSLAGVTLFPGENLIIVDFGTATTFDVISKGIVYEGGLIMTGIMSSLEALRNKAAKLPNVDLAYPAGLIAKNTVDGIRSGIINGNGAMVDGLVERIASDQGWKEYRVLATGGLAKLIQHSAKSIHFIDNQLTLKGLYYIWKRKHV